MTGPNLATSTNADVITGGVFGAIVGREPAETVGFYGEVGVAQQGSTTGSAPINLGVAVTYGVIASSTITNTGSTTITGDLALSPGTSVTGSPTVTGTSNINNGAAAAALAAAQAAFTAGNALVGATVLSASTYDAGGHTITPGLYSVGSSLTITGTVILDAGGNPNASFIFQIGSTFLPQNSSVVSLINGAQAKNVYWLVGSSATIGTAAVIKGTIIANVSITDTTGAGTVGHLFALTGAVTFDTNTVVATPAGTGGGTIVSVPDLVALLVNLGLLS